MRNSIVAGCSIVKGDAIEAARVGMGQRIVAHIGIAVPALRIVQVRARIHGIGTQEAPLLARVAARRKVVQIGRGFPIALLPGLK